MPIRRQYCENVISVMPPLKVFCKETKCQTKLLLLKVYAHERAAKERKQEIDTTTRMSYRTRSSKINPEE